MKPGLIALSFIAPAFAQLIQIIDPAPNTVLTPGEPITVSFAQSDSIQAFTDIGIAIALAPCGNTTCTDKSQGLGDVLYAGAYDPATPLPPPQYGSFYENFVVTVPSSFSEGNAALSVVLAGLTGAGPAPFIQTVNITVIVQPGHGPA